MKKYRPYFTLEELKTLRDLTSTSSDHQRLHFYLYKYILDVEAGTRKENLSLAPSISQSLGLDSSAERQAAIDEKSDRMLYESFLSQTSTFVGMSPAQITRLQAYRYTQGHMSLEEQTKYETEQGIMI